MTDRPRYAENTGTACPRCHKRDNVALVDGPDNIGIYWCSCGRVTVLDIDKDPRQKKVYDFE